MYTTGTYASVGTGEFEIYMKHAQKNNISFINLITLLVFRDNEGPKRET